jgi:hypothetical protein
LAFESVVLDWALERSVGVTGKGGRDGAGAKSTVRDDSQAEAVANDEGRESETGLPRKGGPPVELKNEGDARPQGVDEGAAKLSREPEGRFNGGPVRLQL